MRTLCEKEYKRRALKGSIDLWFDENTITPSLAYYHCRWRCSQKRCCINPAALLPYPYALGLRSVALRPTFSSGLPFTSSKLYKKNTRQLHCSRISFFRATKQRYINREAIINLCAKIVQKQPNFF